METIKELLEILKDTPEMALWGLGIYFGALLLKMASWVGALTLVSKLFINRYFSWKSKSDEIRKEIKKFEVDVKTLNPLIRGIDRSVISGNEHLILKLYDTMKGYKCSIESDYVHGSDIVETIKLIENAKNKKNDARG